jgi:ribosomal protein S21
MKLKDMLSESTNEGLFDFLKRGKKKSPTKKPINPVDDDAIDTDDIIDNYFDIADKGLTFLKKKYKGLKNYKLSGMGPGKKGYVDIAIWYQQESSDELHFKIHHDKNGKVTKAEPDNHSADEFIESTNESVNMKLKDMLSEDYEFTPGKVYSNPYVKAFVKESEESDDSKEEEPSTAFTPEQKKEFMESVARFNEYKKAIFRNEGLKESFDSIKGLVETANKLTLTETEDWFDKVTVSRHMKRMNESFKVFEKTISEVNTLQQRLESSYEEIGEVLNKYYKIQDNGTKLSEAIKNGNTTMKLMDLLKEETEYQKFFKSALDKFGAKSPNELEGDKKKEFFDYVDTNWDAGENETDVDESATESKNDKEIRKLQQKISSIRGQTPAARGRKAAIEDEITRLKNESVNEGIGDLSDKEKETLASIVNRTGVIPTTVDKKSVMYIKPAGLQKAHKKAASMMSDKGKKMLDTLFSKINESINEESSELKKIEDAIKMFKDKIEKQGRVTNARDNEHLDKLIAIYKKMGGKSIKESKFISLVELRPINKLTSKKKVKEGKDDYSARHGKADINLKKGYKHHSEDELEQLYSDLGSIVKGKKVKKVDVIFERLINESTKLTDLISEVSKGHYEFVGNQTLVDSNFVNSVKGVLPDSKLVHLGMGDFALKTPLGTIEFQRTSKISGIGADFVGRPHRVVDKANQFDELLNKMKKSKKAVLSMSESINEDFVSTVLGATGGIAAATYALFTAKNIYNAAAKSSDKFGNKSYARTNILKWGTKFKKDTRIGKIVSRLRTDKDIIAFFDQSESKQRGKWTNLISSKLTADDKKHLSTVFKRHFNE